MGTTDGFGGMARRPTTMEWERRPLRARLGELGARGGWSRRRLPRAVKIALLSELVIAMVVVLMTTTIAITSS